MAGPVDMCHRVQRIVIRVTGNKPGLQSAYIKALFISQSSNIRDTRLILISIISTIINDSHASRLTHISQAAANYTIFIFNIYYFINKKNLIQIYNIFKII